ncbi:MAG: VacB/RNase II family 3'-5' exoribonuclease [Acidobacteria bacterium]|nr:VacB/RNase II family 3'-5' exoribonuclease [Acidobacteriota bacterium]
MRELPPHSEILKLFEENPHRTFRLREIVLELGLRSSQARELKSALKELARRRKIAYLKKSHFALDPADHRPAVPSREHARNRGGGAAASSSRKLVSGRLIGHRDGYGFVVLDQPVAGMDQDIFIPPGGMGSALHGDRVEVHVARPRPDGRLEGRIVTVRERAQKTVVGEFRCGERFNYVLPHDHRIPREIVIPRGKEWPAEDEARRDRQFGGESEGSRTRRAAPGATRSERELEGLIVDVEITSYPAASELARGRVIEVLGKRDDFGVDVEIIVRKFHLPHRFPVEVLAEASAAPQFIPEREREGRRDFRSLPIVTIDGESAKDFDDAVLVERRPGGGYLLQVHIADVAHYVRPGTPLDREARLRGTSVYFPDRAVPMLPLDLSNGICSLNPHVDRLVMSALMEIDTGGRTVSCELAPGIIRSAERMTYTGVHAVLSGEAAACARYSHLVENFKLMEELARVLNKRREARGSIDFDLPEPEIEFDENGRMTGITRSERNIAHRLIEEFMLAANEAVAEFFESKGIASLYRIHEKPAAKKVLEFEEIAATFGYSLGIELPASRRVRESRRDQAKREDRHPRFQEIPETRDFHITPYHYQRLTQRIEGKPEERILSFLMLRSLKQAHYSEENQGHFALAAPTYTHFTSPIRRYPDLIVHRILKAALVTVTPVYDRRSGLPPLVPLLNKEGSKGRSVLTERRYITASSSPLPPGEGGTAERGRVREKNAAPYPSSAEKAAGTTALPGGAFVHLRELQAMAIETSEAERRAQDAERELMEWKKVNFMAQHLGDEFDALIISLTKHGFFVELTDLFVEGFVPLESLVDDRYVYRESQRAAVGQNTKRAFQLGGRVRVRLDRVDRMGNKLQFAVAE